MADDALLSDLCTICNTAKSKYRCPGCAAQTCSLPCYKRHQQWAQCNGKRDPTKYVKKSQLATPAGIDHDFNFLTGIERGLEKAGGDVDRSCGTPSGLQQDSHGRKPSDQQYAAAGVTVIRAPKGLSRQKDNKTHRGSKSGTLIWTVEWIGQDQTRVLTESSSNSPILQVQPFRPAKKATKKRKRDTKEPPTAGPPADQDDLVPILVKSGQNQVEAEHEKPESSSPGRPNSGRNNAAASADRVDNDVEMGVHDHARPSIVSSESESVSPKYNFFLLRPRTSSSRRVLIPLDPTTTLADCLRGRIVLEFPTIYMFSTSIELLPQQFTLERDYLKQEGEEQREFEALVKNVSPETLQALKDENSNDNAIEEIDSKKVLDVLKQDIGTGL